MKKKIAALLVLLMMAAAGNAMAAITVNGSDVPTDSRYTITNNGAIISGSGTTELIANDDVSTLTIRNANITGIEYNPPSVIPISEGGHALDLRGWSGTLHFEGNNTLTGAMYENDSDTTVSAIYGRSYITIVTSANSGDKVSLYGGVDSISKKKYSAISADYVTIDGNVYAEGGRTAITGEIILGNVKAEVSDDGTNWTPFNGGRVDKPYFCAAKIDQGVAAADLTKTGDSSMLGAWALLLAMAGAGMILNHRRSRN